jgi:hypothetical protein
MSCYKTIVFEVIAFGLYHRMGVFYVEDVIILETYCHYHSGVLPRHLIILEAHHPHPNYCIDSLLI